MDATIPTARLWESLLRRVRQLASRRCFSWSLLVGLLPLHLGGNHYANRNGEAAAPTLTTLADSKVFLAHQSNLTRQLVSPHLNGEVLKGVMAKPYRLLAAHGRPPPDVPPRVTGRWTARWCLPWAATSCF